MRSAWGVTWNDTKRPPTFLSSINWRYLPMHWRWLMLPAPPVEVDPLWCQVALLALLIRGDLQGGVMIPMCLDQHVACLHGGQAQKGRHEGANRSHLVLALKVLERAVFEGTHGGCERSRGLGVPRTRTHDDLIKQFGSCVKPTTITKCWLRKLWIRAKHRYRNVQFSSKACLSRTLSGWWSYNDLDKCYEGSHDVDAPRMVET